MNSSAGSKARADIKEFTNSAGEGLRRIENELSYVWPTTPWPRVGTKPPARCGV